MSDCSNTYGPKGLEDMSTTSDQGCGPSESSLRSDCKPWQLTLSGDSAIIDSYVAESMNIASGDSNVYKLLGVHEQTKLIDATGFGNPISGGQIAAYPASNAFNIFDTSWKSVQRGTEAIVASSYIGYDFGLIKTNNEARRRYSVDDAAIYKHITGITLKQSSNSNERAGKIRVERSQCGEKWKGVQVIDLPDDDCLNTFLLKDSVTSRFWRIRPIEFNGDDNNSWCVNALQLIENYLATDESNIQDKILLENRDREYDMSTLSVKIYWDIQETQTDLTRYGLEMNSETLFVAANFSSVVSSLGRPFIIGDILQIPALTQFSATMEPIEKYMEVVDTFWAAEGYTPGWQPTLQRLVLQPAHASRETQNIFGDLGNEREVDVFGLLGDDGNNPVYQDYQDVTEEIDIQAKIAVPEKGTDDTGVIQWSEDQLESARAQGIDNLESIGQRPAEFQATDGLPPNGEPYTEGDEFPDNPKDKDWHRLTYTNISDQNLPRLHRYSFAKKRWRFIETDYRSSNNSKQPIIQEFLANPTPIGNITKGKIVK